MEKKFEQKPENPKLLMAAKELKDVLDKYDIGGVFIIHTPGHVQFGMKVDPAYSAAFMKGDQLTIRDALILDHAGDQKAQDKKLVDTFNMIVNFRVMCQNLSRSFFGSEMSFGEKIKHLLPKPKQRPPGGPSSNGRIIH